MAAGDGIEILGTPGDRFEEILTPEALQLVATLQRDSGGKRAELLAARLPPKSRWSVATNCSASGVRISSNRSPGTPRISMPSPAAMSRSSAAPEYGVDASPLPQRRSKRGVLKTTDR